MVEFFFVTFGLIFSTIFTHMHRAIHYYYSVMHNGKEPYDGVIQAIRGLKDAGKKLIILSNSSKRRDSSETMLTKRK